MRQSRSEEGLIVLWQSFEMANVSHGPKNFEHLGEQLLVNRLGRPAGPVAYVLGVGAAAHGGGDVRVGEAELKRELGNVYAFVRAMLGGLARGGLDVLGLLQPRGQGSAREQARAERAGVHDAH